MKSKYAISCKTNYKCKVVRVFYFQLHNLICCGREHFSQVKKQAIQFTSEKCTRLTLRTAKLHFFNNSSFLIWLSNRRENALETRFLTTFEQKYKITKQHLKTCQMLISFKLQNFVLKTKYCDRYLQHQTKGVRNY